MGLKSLIKFCFHRTLEIIVIFSLIAFIPGLPPKATFNESYKLKTAPHWKNELSVNNKLDDVELWHKGEFVGPESFAVYKNELYTGVYGGDVVKLVGNHVVPITKFGKPCKGLHEEKICGRPLGLTFDENGALYVADAYYGIFKVNVQTGEKQQIISPNVDVDGKKLKIFNSLVVTKNGDIFYTTSSSEFDLEDGIYTALADPSGRLLQYSARTRTNKVLLDKVHFANGLALSDDEQFLLVSETFRNRVWRYYIDGPKKNTKEIFLDALPGSPDNIKSDGKDGFLVSMITLNDENHPSLVALLAPFPTIRRAIVRAMVLFENSFKLVDQYFPNEFSKRATHIVGSFQMATFAMKISTVFLHVSKNGDVLANLQTEKISKICEANIFGDQLVLGSPWNDFIGKIPLSKVGLDHLKASEKVTTTTARPTTTTPRPTTTTPKPVTTTTTPKPTTTQKQTTTPKPTTTTPRPTTTTPRPTTTTPKPTTTTPKPTTTTRKPATTTPKTTPKPTTTKPTKPSVVTPKSTTTTAKPQEAKKTTQTKPIKEDL